MYTTLHVWSISVLKIENVCGFVLKIAVNAFPVMSCLWFTFLCQKDFHDCIKIMGMAAAVPRHLTTATFTRLLTCQSIVIYCMLCYLNQGRGTCGPRENMEHIRIIFLSQVSTQHRVKTKPHHAHRVSEEAYRLLLDIDLVFHLFSVGR